MKKIILKSAVCLSVAGAVSAQDAQNDNAGTNDGQQCEIRVTQAQLEAKKALVDDSIFEIKEIDVAQTRAICSMRS